MSRARRLLSRWGAAPEPVRDAAAGLVRAVGSSVASVKMAAVLESDGSLAAAWPVTRQLFSKEQRLALLAPERSAAVEQIDPYVQRLTEVFGDHPEAGVWAQVSYAESRTYMHDVLLRDTDQMSMAHGLEVRVPLLDQDLVQYVMSLPDHIRRLADTPKPLLVAAMEADLPDEIVQRPKRGFTLPFDPWMRSTIRDFCGVRIRRLDERSVCRRGAVTSLWQRFLDGDRATSWSRLWALVALESWIEQNGAGEPA
jgi:asparagine synthase (glutamine-hydrolysing)